MDYSPDMIQGIVLEAVKSHGRERDALIPIMQYVQDRAGGLDHHAMETIAQLLDISSADVWGTATFYSFFKTKPCGKYVIQLCKTISCDLKDKEAIVAAIEEKLGIRAGETTPDKRFTLLETNCLGLCHQGPAMLVNNEVFMSLTAEKVVQIIDGLPL